MPDGHAGQDGFAAADDVPARGHEMHEVAVQKAERC